MPPVDRGAAMPISLRSSADVIAAFELVAAIAFKADDRLDLGTRMRMIAMCAAGASRSLDAAALEARIDALERQTVSA